MDGNDYVGKIFARARVHPPSFFFQEREKLSEYCTAS